MEKRVIIAFVLSFAVLYAFRALSPAPPPPAEQAAAPAQTTPPASPNTTAESAPKPASAQSPEVVAENLKGEKPEEFVFNTALYTATFSNQGAVLKSFKLRLYTDGQGNPLELINQEAGEKVGWPLVVITGDKALDDALTTAQYAGRSTDNKLTLEYAASGLHARKVLEFDPDKYEFSLQTTVTKDGRSIPHSVVWQGRFGDQSIPQDPNKENAVYQTDATFKRVPLRGLKDPQDLTTIKSGVEDQYFLAMFLSPDTPSALKVRKQEYPGSDNKPVPTLAVSTSATAKPMHLYVGPKQRDALSQVDPQLSAVVDYGWFGFIAKPLVWLLLVLHTYVGNFGWTIILLTVGLNAVMFPLTLKQQSSMTKMQKIQPQMKRLQDQYKKLKPTDPRRPQVQADMMNLYKEHGVNPMGGCLPLLLQMPFLFGFYSALAYSIELRRAPWMLWIKDLSQPDPYYVIPILMAVAIVVQQKLTPTANVDPAQAKMMMIMPVMMTFLFLSYASGLSLYWLTSNVVGIARQVVINKYWSPHLEAKINAKTRPNETRGT